MLTPLSEHALMFLRLSLTSVFVLAVVAKLRDLPAFVKATGDLSGLPARAARPAAVAVVAAEGAAAFMTGAGGAALRWGLLLAAVLLLVFSAQLTRALLRGRRISCNCFGRGTQPISALDLIRNAGLITCACAALLLQASAPRQGVLQADALALVTVMAALSVTVWLRLPDVSLILRPGRRPATAKESMS
ncbi:MauE/DoxX family redox-associated membrane protein [Streptosporangium sp. NPDC004379]|uniref:MauE/DoxX family redox-associated membrane protein n=1 Tax=Streptosporangium sp. NPDC004379 TaxID=3366189 RepID=UPI00368DD430